jgi:hypothetical protein
MTQPSGYPETGYDLLTDAFTMAERMVAVSVAHETVLGFQPPTARARGLVQSGWTPEHFTRMAQVAAHAEHVNGYLYRVEARRGDATSLQAPWLALAFHASEKGGQVEDIFSWLLVIGSAGDRDTAMTLIMNLDTWSGPFPAWAAVPPGTGKRLGYMAGLSPEECLQQDMTAVAVDRLRLLGTLRGFRLPATGSSVR